jgi:CBS domain-containing protein
MTINDWLTETKASDIMVRRVITLGPQDTLAQAAAVFLREQISGAPVVGHDGVCVGVCSASDILRAENTVLRERTKVAESSFWNSNLALPASIYEQKLAEVRDKIAPVAEQLVQQFMTANVVAIRDHDPVRKIAEAMLDAHIHRVIVVDASNRLLGIISTIDLLAAILKADRLTKKA